MRPWLPGSLALYVALALSLASERALACSVSVPGLFAPYFDAKPVPQNFRLFRWRGDEGDDGYELLDAGGKNVQLRRERLGGRVDTLPMQPAAPGTYRFHRPHVDEMPLVVRAGVDTSPPKLRAVGRPRAVHWPSTGMCGAQDDTSIRVDATDDSPMFVAVWGTDHGEPDLTGNPVLYAQIENGTVELRHARQQLDIEPGKGSWAVMAIDAAGNVSDVVSTPSGRRVPGVVFVATPGEVMPLRTPEAEPTPHADLIEDEPPVARGVLPAPRPRGCGCDVPGGHVPRGWLLPIAALLLGVTRGRCRPRRTRPKRPERARLR